MIYICTYARCERMSVCRWDSRLSVMLTHRRRLLNATPPQSCSTVGGRYASTDVRICGKTMSSCLSRYAHSTVLRGARMKSFLGATGVRDNFTFFLVRFLVHTFFLIRTAQARIVCKPAALRDSRDCYCDSKCGKPGYHLFRSIACLFFLEPEMLKSVTSSSSKKLFSDR